MAQRELITQFPHCDSYVLHRRGECSFCDGHPEWQELRQAWGIAFTGHSDEVDTEGYARNAPVLPCPADFKRPAGAANDHRRWGGNKPTTAEGDPAWPQETAASVWLYGDQGGREPWPLPERVVRRIRRPLEDLAKRWRGWHKTNGWWHYP